VNISLVLGSLSVSQKPLAASVGENVDLLGLNLGLDAQSKDLLRRLNAE
jgi:hypothetical protein